MSKWVVWIDQDLCTGDGLCEEVCPDIFYGHDDGLYYVKPTFERTGLDADGNPRWRMGHGTVDVPDNLLDATIEAAEECPGECIFIDQVPD